MRRFNQEFLDYIINPFINGIYAEILQLSISKAFQKLVEIEEKYGSIIKGFKFKEKTINNKLNDKRIFTFDEGLQTLPLKWQIILMIR